MIMRKLAVFCAASSLVLLAACSDGQAPASSTSSAATASSSDTLIGSAIARALDKASAEVAKGNVDVSRNDKTLPKAEITPQGDFLIDHKPVPLTPAQRQEMLAYRQHIVEIAQQGIAIGKQGASLGLSAAGAAIAGALAGESDQQIRQRVEAKTTGIRKEAVKICDRLPAMMAEQQKLAADVPAFKPYATMTQQDIEDCRNGALKDGDADRAGTRGAIRSSIRSGVQPAAQHAGMASRGTTDAPAASGSAGSGRN